MKKSSYVINLSQKVTTSPITGLTVEDLKSTSRKRKVVHGRSIVAYVAVRNHGYKGSELADVLSLSCPTISSYLEKGKIFLLCREDKLGLFQ